jgi:hypothetical protein
MTGGISVCYDIIQFITPLYGSLLLLVLVASGFIMMFAPAKGTELLKNAGISLVVFVIASILLGSLCGAH